jgi:hypothetical protein
MKDWKAAARNWMLNIPKYHENSLGKKMKNSLLKEKESKPQRNFSSKNYKEPL